MYKRPIVINGDDPLCSASVLGNTVIGILFEKTGKEIRGAITSRIVAIDDQIGRYESSIQNLEGFIHEKRGILKAMEDTRRMHREDEDRVLRPLRRKQDEIQKAYRDQLDDISKEIKDTKDSIRRKTDADIEEKAVDFEKSFDDLQQDFKDLEDIVSIPSVTIYSSSSTGIGVTGPGTTFSCSDGTGWVTQNSTTGNVGIGNDTPSAMLHISSPEEKDKAMARLNGLKAALNDYEDKVRKVQGKIQELREEKRRLELIANNINEERSYKLDLTKLSAFGFEDVEIKG